MRIYMKKYILALLSGALLLSLTGCSVNSIDSNTSLSLMEEVNHNNVYHSDPDCRLWYQITPEVFADSDQDGKGDLRGILPYLSYLSDNDPSKIEEDLNISGLFLNNILASDSSGSVIDYYRINSSIGTDQDLEDLCAQASEMGLPVMMELDIASCSAKNQDFQDLVSEADNLEKDQGIDDLNPELASMFTLSTEQANSNWIQLGSSNIYYLGFAGTDSPNYDQDSETYRSMVEGVIAYYLSFGIQGFYIDDANAFYSNSGEKNADFVNWITDTVHAINPDAWVVVSANNPGDEFSEVHDAWIADDSNIGAEGNMARAVTGSLSASDLGKLWAEEAERNDLLASFINNSENTLDLLKSQKRMASLKMLLGVQLLSSGQVFLMAGDEIGLPSTAADLVSEGLNPEETEKNEENAQNSSEEGKSQNQDAAPEDGETEDTLQFGYVLEQSQDGDSVLNYVRQAVLLRDSYTSLSSGKPEILEDLTDSEILAVHKSIDRAEIVVLYNFASETKTVDISSLTLSGIPAEIGGILLTGDETVTLEDGTLSLPAQSICILK